MKTKLQLKKTVWWVCFLFMGVSLSAQNQGFCEPFDQFQATNLAGSTSGTYVEYNTLDNWGTICTTIQYTDNQSQNGTGDLYLYMDDGPCSNGSSWIFNPVDYSGNWIDMVGGEGCFCYDFRTFEVVSGTINGNSLRIMDGPDPTTSTVSATFVLSTPIDVTAGWVRICPPISLSDPATGDLPGNADGQWVISSGGAAAWDALITGVGSIAYLVDVASGNELFGIDNLCISEVCDGTFNEDPPTEEGAWCCDKEGNLVENGNFEFGDTGFASDYTQNTATLPGQYDVTDSAAAFGASITDHSFCVDSTAYATNDLFMVVNGKTTQPSGTVSTIWEQTITGLDPSKEYRFCANFKNMPQCTFDILPKISIETSNGYVQTATVATTSDPCDWQLESFCFTADEEITIKINLSEDGLGDGNDLAIDDISVQELEDPNLQISVLHQGTPQQVTGSIFSIGTGDDVLPYDPEICEDPYYWTVLTLSAATNSGYTIDWTQQYGWGNDTMGSQLFMPPSSGPDWDLTTNYPGFSFQQNTLYLVAFYTPSCCIDCVDDGFTYQIIYNNGLQASNTGLSKKDEQAIIEFLGDRVNGQLGVGENDLESDVLKVYPNPMQDVINVSLLDGALTHISLYGLNGQLMIEKEMTSNAKQEVINVAALTSGVYFLKVKSADGKEYNSKVIKE